MAMDLNATTTISEILKVLSLEELQHMLRVGVLVEHFAEVLKSTSLGNIPRNEPNYWGQAAFYHDIGKAWVPSTILAKPERLTEAETKIIRKHPMFAKKLFADMKKGLFSGIAKELIPLSADSAIYHHEWWNGCGYPHGIKQEEIPLIARVTSICDAYDAMTTKRVYQKSLSREQACYELLRCAGTQFDPRLVTIFLSIKAFSDISKKELFT